MVGRNAREAEVIHVLQLLMRAPRTFFLFTRDEAIMDMIQRAYNTRRLCPEGRLVRCSEKVETVEDPRRQRSITLDYHQGITNHRGAPEMAAQLKTEYFWPKMVRTCAEVIKACEVCSRAKVDRRKRDAPEEVTQTPVKAWEVVEFDIFTWENRKYLTFVDRFSKIDGAIWVRRKSAEETVRALTEIFARYGCPTMIVSDRGREFDNEQVKRLLREMRVQHHLTTAGHPKSRGTIERFYGTLTEHLRILKEEGRIGDREAYETFQHGMCPAGCNN